VAITKSLELKLRYGASLKDRLEFRRRIDPDTGCWLYIGHLNKKGYGKIKVNGKPEQVHRVALEVYKGITPFLALHIPGCPNKHCFNPEHLYDGDYTDNIRDRYGYSRRTK
jgi:hypothetical protein